MANVKVNLQFTGDNRQLAIDEILLQINSLGFTATVLGVTDTKVEKTEDDWFDDYVFTVTAIVHHDTMTKEEIKEKLNKQNIFECCEILE